MKKIFTKLTITIVFAISFILVVPVMAENDVAKISSSDAGSPNLHHIIGTLEHLRGFEKTGFSFTAEVIGIDGQKEQSRHQLYVKVSSDGYALVEIVAPESEKGRRTLVRDQDMWLYLPSSVNVMRIAPLQKVFGEASIADILNTSYANDYSVENASEQDSQKNMMLIFRAKNKSSTYEKIELAYDVAGDAPKYSRHFTSSGRLLKTMNYHTFAMYDNERKVEKISINDEVRKNFVMWIKLSNYKKESFPEHIFTKAGFTKN